MEYKPEGLIEDAEIVVVAEAPAREEMRLGRPLVGPSGKIFDAALQKAAILRTDCYITNVIPHPVAKDAKGAIFDDYRELCWNDKGITPYAKVTYVEPLIRNELSRTKANVIIALGGTAANALLGNDVPGITKIRGSVFESPIEGIRGRKIIPMIHPAAILHGSPNWRYMLDWDMKKAKREKNFPDVRKPTHDFEFLKTTERTLELLEQINSSCEGSKVVVDIEIQNRQVICIGFGLSATRAICVDFYDRTPEQEAKLWLGVSKVLENPKIGKIFQNGMFDIGFLLTQCNILVRGRIEDTMVAHHIMYPDLPKGMGFLQSIYTDEPYHKDMVKHSGIEKNEG